jgi:hypothetical protein
MNALLKHANSLEDSDVESFGKPPLEWRRLLLPGCYFYYKEES